MRSDPGNESIPAPSIANSPPTPMEAPLLIARSRLLFNATWRVCFPNITFFPSVTAMTTTGNHGLINSANSSSPLSSKSFIGAIISFSNSSPFRSLSMISSAHRVATSSVVTISMSGYFSSARQTQKISSR